MYADTLCRRLTPMPTGGDWVGLFAKEGTDRSRLGHDTDGFEADKGS